MTDSPPRMLLTASMSFVRPDGISDAASALRVLAEAAVEQGYAEPSFVDAVLDREQTFPTGLPLPLPTAIPHADAAHVRRPGLAALVPRKALPFGEMGRPGATVEVRLVLMLLVTRPQEQVTVLSRLLTVLQSADLEDRLLGGLDDPSDLSDRLSQLLDR